MSVAQSVAEVLDEHVTLEVECIDRMYCNLYIPILQAEAGVVWFFREHRGYDFASSALMAPMTKKFVDSIEAFAAREGVELITFKRGQRKEDVAKGYLAEFSGQEGVLFIGKAQEKASVVRSPRPSGAACRQEFARENPYPPDARDRRDARRTSSAFMKSTRPPSSRVSAGKLLRSKRD